MIRYKSNKQITIEEFKTPFEIKLDKETGGQNFPK